jgi:hypothetical protein
MEGRFFENLENSFERWIKKMILQMTDEELELFHKRSQISFILRRKKKNKSDSELQRVDERIFNLSDDEIEKLFKQHEDLINKETWVDCHPMFFHITEFEEALKSQLDYIKDAKQDDKLKKSIRVEWIQETDAAINDLFKRVNKFNLSELTIEEKEDLFWITHPITY